MLGGPAGAVCGAPARYRPPAIVATPPTAAFINARRDNIGRCLLLVVIEGSIVVERVTESNLRNGTAQVPSETLKHLHVRYDTFREAVETIAALQHRNNTSLTELIRE